MNPFYTCRNGALGWTAYDTIYLNFFLLSVQVTPVACVLRRNWWCDESPKGGQIERERERWRRNVKKLKWNRWGKRNRSDGKVFQSSKKRSTRPIRWTDERMEQFNLNLEINSEYELKEMGWENWLKWIECLRAIIAANATHTCSLLMLFYFSALCLNRVQRR